MSREEPNIVYSPDDSNFYLGGAGIVAAHSSSLGAKVDFISILGNDNLGEFAKKRLKEYNVKPHLFHDDSTSTNLKVRYRYQK